MWSSFFIKTKKTEVIGNGSIWLRNWQGRKKEAYKYEWQHFLIVILLFYEDGVIKSTSQDAVLEIGNCNILFFVLTSQVYSISLLTTLNVLSILHSSFPFILLTNLSVVTHSLYRPHSPPTHLPPPPPNILEAAYTADGLKNLPMATK